MSKRFRLAPLELVEEHSDEVLFLADASVSDWARIFDHATSRRFSEGETIMEEGARDRALCFLTEGRLTLVGAAVYKTIEAPSVIGEVAFLDGLPRSAGLVAATDGEIACLDRDAYEALAAADPDLARRMALELGRILALRLRMRDGQ